MKKGTEVWFKTGFLTAKPGIIQSYAGEGYYWVENTEKKTIHYCFILEMQKIKKL